MADQMMNVATAAEYMGVSEDTVRALIRAGTLPAHQHRPRGGYEIKETDVHAITEARATGKLAGPVTIDPVELAQLVADEMWARAHRAQAKADEVRRNNRAREIRAASGQGYGAVTDMAAALGLHRTVVQRWLKDAIDVQATADVEAAEAAAVAAADEADRAVRAAERAAARKQ